MFSQRVKYAIQILSEFERAKRDGVRLTKRHLHEQCGMNPMVVSTVLRVLHVSQWVNYVGSAYFSTKDLRSATLYDLVIVVDGSVSMDMGVSEGWPILNRPQSTNAKLITERVTANFINELMGINLSEMFDCYQTTDRRTLSHIRRNSANKILAFREIIK